MQCKMLQLYKLIHTKLHFFMNVNWNGDIVRGFVLTENRSFSQKKKKNQRIKSTKKYSLENSLPLKTDNNY